MRITSLILKDYNLVKESGITEMHVDFTEDVQLFIGPNGCGKSSTMRQLSVTPSPRTMFGKQGAKSEIIEHNGTYFRLESDYTKPSSPHAFYEGDSDENLNVGRTTHAQQELIAEHLGITPLVDDLIMNRFVFPKWTPSKRKEFLMDVNPDQIKFVLTDLKRIQSKIKACKNNIARLQSRKILLEQDLLDDQTVTELSLEKDTINDDLSKFQRNLMDIEIGLHPLKTHRQGPSLSDIPAIRKTIRQARYRLAHFPHISRDDAQRQLDREKVLEQLAVCRQRLVELDEDVMRYSQELIELESRYNELALDGDLKTTDDTIRHLEGERDKLQVARPPFELSAKELEAKSRELSVIQGRLDIFSQLSITLLPMKRRRHRERMLQSSQYKQSSWRTRLSDLESQYEEATRRHSIQPKDIPDSPCAKDACPLYSHFMGEYKTTEKKRQALQNAIDKGRRKIARMDLFVGGLSNYLEQSQPYVTQIEWLISEARNNPILHHVLRSMDILSVLSTNPNRIVRQLEDEYDRIDRWLRLKAIMSDLETAYALKSRQISSESHDTIKLVTVIDETRNTLSGLRNAIHAVSKRRVLLERELKDITTFSDIKDTVLTIQRNHLEMMEILAQGHERDKLNLLHKGVKELMARHFVRMSDIERTLRSQSSLKDRYQEEVVSQIGIIEKELADLQQMETALILIPKENMIGFINTVFDQANRLIKSIWTIPLSIELMGRDDPLTYEFQVSGDNESLRELSECSEGQTEILSLAINLSLRMVLGHLNLPICLDETGRTFDEKHKHNLILLLRRLLDEKIISQLFLVSHNAVIHDGFVGTETLVIREDNIMLPPIYNQHATIQ
jgi:energy-coupling factor transporter ATP-binding protein EcfA2